MPSIGPGLAITPVTLLAFPATLTDMANALAEVLVCRVKIDLAPYAEVSLSGVVVVSSASVNSPRIFLQYSPDESTWTTLMTATISLAAAGGTARRTVWETIPLAAKTDIFIRLVGQGGDAAADPVIANVMMNLR